MHDADYPYKSMEIDHCFCARIPLFLSRWSRIYSCKKSIWKVYVIFKYKHVIFLCDRLNLRLSKIFISVRKNFCFYLDIQEPVLSRSISRRLQDMGLVSKHVFFCRQNFLGVEGTRDVSMQFCGYVYNFRQLNIVHL